MPEAPGEGDGNTISLGRASVSGRTLRSLTVSKAKEVSSAEHCSHSPGMP